MTGKPPRQGALVVLLSAMLMVNLSVVIVVLVGGWFDKRGPVEGQAVAEVEPQPTAPPRLPSNDRASLQSPDSASGSDTPAPAGAPGVDVVVPSTNPVLLPAPAPPAVQPEPGVTHATPPAAPQPQPVTTQSPVEFFGIPVLE